MNNNSNDELNSNVVTTVPVNVNPEIVSNLVDSQELVGEVKVSDLDLSKKFIGEKYDSFVNDKFNIWAFLLGFVYLFYRKMYLYAGILFAVSVLISAFISSFIVIILDIVLGFLFNKLYLKFVEDEVIKIKVNSPNSTNEQLLKIAELSGGVSFEFALGSGCLFFVVLLILMVFASIVGITSLIK